MFAHSRDPHPAIKLWCQVPFTKSKTTFQIEMYCMKCFLKSKYIKSRTFNDKNRCIIKKVMVFKKLLQHLATRGTYSPGDWRCDEAWREQTLVYPPVMCQQRLIYCTWELNVMSGWLHPGGLHQYRDSPQKLQQQWHQCASLKQPQTHDTQMRTEIYSKYYIFTRTEITLWMQCLQAYR